MRTCGASRSASEYTATVPMPRRRQVRITRHAISPRFAIRILSNMRAVSPVRGKSMEALGRAQLRGAGACRSAGTPQVCFSGRDPEDEEARGVFGRLSAGGSSGKAGGGDADLHVVPVAAP